MMRSNDQLGVTHDGVDLRQAPAQPAKASKPTMSEYEMQQEVVRLAAEAALHIPEYGLLFAVPNGQYRRGQRPEAGMRAGVPDLCLPAARGGYHGMFIELKVGRNKTSASQRAWLDALRDQGYYCIVVYDDPTEVITKMLDYLQMTA